MTCRSTTAAFCAWAPGFGSLTGTPYTEDGVQKTGNTILLNGGGVLGMLDADWSNENEMVVNAGGKAFVLDTTGYDPDSMTASGNSHVMTLNGTVKPGGASGTIIVRNSNAGKNGRVVLGAANTWDGIYQVTDHAALELALRARSIRKPESNSGSGFPTGREGRNGFYAASVKLAGAGASVNTLNSSSLSDISVAVTARTGAASSTVERAFLGSSAGAGIVQGAGSAARALFNGVNVNVRTGAALAHAGFSGSVLEVAAGQEARVTDMLIHQGGFRHIRLGAFSSLAVTGVSTTDSVPNLNISYADGNFSMTAPDAWTTNALITGAGQASVDFSGGVNLLLTECSGDLIEKLVEARVSTINFLLYDGSLTNAFSGDYSLATVLYDAALKNAGFILANGDSWMRDGVVTLAIAHGSRTRYGLRSLLGLGAQWLAAPPQELNS